jgi:hypothetical protein
MGQFWAWTSPLVLLVLLVQGGLSVLTITAIAPAATSLTTFTSTYPDMVTIALFHLLLPKPHVSLGLLLQQVFSAPRACGLAMGFTGKSLIQQFLSKELP